MVSFICDYCQNVVQRKTALKHYQKCQAPMSCVDCQRMFHGKFDHTSCITETEKYHKQKLNWKEFKTHFKALGKKVSRKNILFVKKQNWEVYIE